jgi:hypothetical protein
VHWRKHAPRTARNLKTESQALYEVSLGFAARFRRKIDNAVEAIKLSQLDSYSESIKPTFPNCPDMTSNARFQHNAQGLVNADEMIVD